MTAATTERSPTPPPEPAFSAADDHVIDHVDTLCDLVGALNPPPTIRDALVIVVVDFANEIYEEAESDVRVAIEDSEVRVAHVADFTDFVDLAERLHMAAHGDRWPLRSCMETVCVDLLDKVTARTDDTS